METGEHQAVLETLNRLAQMEAAMARFYTACSEIWADMSGFWMDLALEEEKHAQVVRDLAEIVKTYPDHFRVGLRIEASAIESFIKTVDERIPDLLRGKVTLKGALDFALHMELSIIEGRFFELVVGETPRYSHFAEVMSADLEKHRARITEALEKVGKEV